MAETQMQLEDWLDDLCVRFIINLPQEDLSSVARICFQVEEAQWFYEDFIRPLDPTLPSMSLRVFFLRIFQHCPLMASFSVENYTRAFEEFLQYKTRVPVRGAIMLNHPMDSVVLVKGWKKGASWSFPRGKINKDEGDLDCAIREVWEETGLDLRASGLVPKDKKPKYIEISMREQQLRLYVFRDISMDTDFHPQTRKEISKIHWFKLSELPVFRKKGDKTARSHENVSGDNFGKFYMVAPFLVSLKKWIASQKKMEDKRATSRTQVLTGVLQHPAHIETSGNEDRACAPKKLCSLPPAPAIDTLDGATREIQRLSKTQPSQNIIPQSCPNEDKCSALLSILQSDSLQCQEKRSMPQTPSYLTASKPPQPRNPHHHTNQYPLSQGLHVTGPPPTFHLASNQAAMISSRSEEPGLDSSRSPLTSEKNPQLPDSGLVVPLAHPQPLPLQVPKDRLSRSATHGSTVSSSISQCQQEQSQIRGQLHDLALGSLKSRPAQLDEHSMTLLRVLKGDQNHLTRLTEVSKDGQSRLFVSVQAEQNSLLHFSDVLPQRLRNLADDLASDHSPMKMPGESIGSNVSGLDDHHRFALLEMFKKSRASAVDQGASCAGRTGSESSSRTKEKMADEMAVLQDALDEKSHVPVLSLNHAPSTTRVTQPGSLERQDWGTTLSRTYPSGQEQGDMVSPAPIQISEVFQQEAKMREDAPRFPPRSTAHELQTQTRPEQHPAGGPHVNMMARLGQGPGWTGASHEQKKQLLSLFGKQQSPSKGGGNQGGLGPPVATSASARGEILRAGSVSAASSRRGTETPISPADQSFLLEYLQTVTNNASR